MLFVLVLLLLLLLLLLKCTLEVKIGIMLRIIKIRLAVLFVGVEKRKENWFLSRRRAGGPILAVGVGLVYEGDF